MLPGIDASGHWQSASIANKVAALVLLWRLQCAARIAIVQQDWAEMKIALSESEFSV